MPVNWWWIKYQILWNPMIRVKTRKPILGYISVCKQNRITNLGLSLLLGAGREDLGFCRPEALGDCIERGDKLLLICGLFLPVPAPPWRAAGDLELTRGLCMIGVSPFSSKVGAVKIDKWDNTEAISEQYNMLYSLLWKSCAWLNENKAWRGLPLWSYI